MSQKKTCVLVVDDEQAIRRFLHVTLASQDYTIQEAANGKDALSAASSFNPDAVILDLCLPDLDGIEVTRRLREWTQVPIIILSVKGSEKDKIAALDAGANDYLTKPFGAGELLARIRVALRRAAQPGDEPVFVAGSLKLDIARRTVTLDDVEIQLTPTEYGLLRILTVNAGRVLTHRSLLRQVWGEAYELESHILHVNISNLRHKIENNPARPRFIVTEPGVGYRFKAG